MIEICNTCGGTKNAFFATTAVNHMMITGNPIVAATHPFAGATVLLCHCFPEKHDGHLGGQYKVSQANGAWGFEGMLLEDTEHLVALLSPPQALSLLAWLLQEEPIYRQLIKEEKEKQE